MEAFETIQGEGFHTGRAAYFLRLAGCDVGCHWCDVKESWDASQHPSLGTDTIISDMSHCPAEIVVVTGGEPLMHDLDILTQAIKSLNKQTHIETAGVYPITGDWDWLCFSPKKFKPALAEYYDRADELKVVIYNQSDFKWAEEHASKMNAQSKLFLQPEWGKKDEMLPLIVDYIKQNPRWQVSLQTHKYMNIP
ncbi:MAG: 4Fe-4S cluster-binding domain-containing protein [Cyclobacteriaceae bacterium]